MGLTLSELDKILKVPDGANFSGFEEYPPSPPPSPPPIREPDDTPLGAPLVRQFAVRTAPPTPRARVG